MNIRDEVTETKLEAFIWEVKWNWNWYIMSPLRQFKQGIKNLWTWKKVIWNDRFYDHSFLHNMMKLKLETMEKAWDEAHYVGSEETKKEITKLIETLDKIEALEDMCTIEADAEMSRLYEDFGKRLFSRRMITSYEEDNTKNRVNYTTLMETLWD